MDRDGGVERKPNKDHVSDYPSKKQGHLSSRWRAKRNLFSSSAHLYFIQKALQSAVILTKHCLRELKTGTNI